MKQEPLPLTEFDLATLDSGLQLLKAYLPFTDLKTQRLLAFMIRILEFVQTVSFYDRLTEPSPLCRNCHDQDFMLNEIKRYCPKKESEIFDMIHRFSNIGDLYNLFQSVQPGEDNNAQPDLMKSFLNPKQKELFDSYSKILGGSHEL